MDLYSTFKEYHNDYNGVSKGRKISLLYSLFDAFDSNRIKEDLVKKSRVGSIDVQILNSLVQVLSVSENIQLHRMLDLGEQLTLLAKSIKTIPHSRISEHNLQFIFDNLKPVMVEYNHMLKEIEYLETIAI